MPRDGPAYVFKAGQRIAPCGRAGSADGQLVLDFSIKRLQFGKGPVLQRGRCDDLAHRFPPFAFQVLTARAFPAPPHHNRLGKVRTRAGAQEAKEEDVRVRSVRLARCQTGRTTNAALLRKGRKDGHQRFRRGQITAQ